MSLDAASVDLLEIGLGELHIQCAEVLLKSMKFGRSRDRHDPRLLCEQPGERDLRRRRAFAFRDSLNQVDQGHIGLACFRRKTRNVVPEIGGIEPGVFVDLPGEEPGAKRTKRHETDTKLFQRRQKLGLRTTPEQRIFALHCCYRLD